MKDAVAPNPRDLDSGLRISDFGEESAILSQWIFGPTDKGSQRTARARDLCRPTLLRHAGQWQDGGLCLNRSRNSQSQFPACCGFCGRPRTDFSSEPGSSFAGDGWLGSRVWTRMHANCVLRVGSIGKETDQRWQPSSNFQDRLKSPFEGGVRGMSGGWKMAWNAACRR